MNSHNPNEKMKRISSIGITLIIVLILIFSGPASAVTISITGLSTEPYTKGSEVNFQVSVTIEENDKYVPISNFTLHMIKPGPVTQDWIFAKNGTVLSGDPSIISIVPDSQPSSSDFGYGYGYGYGYGSGYNFGYGYGYGYNFGYGGGIVTYIYNVTLKTTDFDVGTYTVSASLNTGNAAKQAFTSPEEEFTIKSAYVPPTNGGGGGGGGGGASGEAYENIVCTETDRQYVGKDLSVKYNFILDCNYVQHIEFTGLTSAGKVAAKVEILNHTSTTVDKDAPDIVFKNLNVWVGNTGFFSENKVKDPTITFMVDRSWVTDNDIILNTISFYSYNDDTSIWEKMSTQKIGEDATSYLFKASLPIRGTLGPMAISGKELVYIPTPVPTPTPTPVITPPKDILEIISNATDVTTWTETWKRKVPGFLALTAFIALIALYIIRSRRG